ncbi:hypothetical protein [Pseudomonas sp. EMN2]|uniref:hypothetical protein n=1 Tax=Pseudomonas sp. EMN2 TaxID=2615212 RepID=UPI00129B2A99|nr:hypothetical protein [Pseudomonas sp. EMN2]
MTVASNPSPQEHGLSVVDDYEFRSDFSRGNTSPAQEPAVGGQSTLGDTHEPDFDLSFDSLGHDQQRREPAVDAVSEVRPVEHHQATPPPPQRASTAETVPTPEKVAPAKETAVGLMAKYKWHILATTVAVALCGTVLVVRLSPNDTAAVRPATALVQPQTFNQSGPFEQRVQVQQLQGQVVETAQLGQPYPAESALVPEPSVVELEPEPSVQPVGHEAPLQAVGAAQPAVAPLTEEEVYYDNMAAAASNTGQAATAQASIQPVNQLPAPAPQMADTRFGEVSAQLNRTSADVVKLLEAVQLLRNEFATLQQQVKNDAGKTSAMALRLDNISNQLTVFEKATNQKIEDVSKTAVKAAMAALAKGTKKDDKLVLTGGSMVSNSVPAKSQAVPRPTQVAAVKPQEPVRLVAKSPTTSCNGPISQVWAVKGVSTAAGFIRREADGLGIMVNKDSEVRGFGTVISFDPANRVICTTSGKIVQR